MANIDRATGVPSGVGFQKAPPACSQDRTPPVNGRTGKREGGLDTYRVNSIKSEMQKYRAQTFLQLVNRRGDPF